LKFTKLRLPLPGLVEIDAQDSRNNSQARRAYNARQDGSQPKEEPDEHAEQQDDTHHQS
jgi:hypothetical protein